MHAAALAALASIESLLSAVAADKLHDGPRANLKRELVGQGAANAVSGAIGGLPVTGVIVRSSTNAMSGARTRASAILHGVWILLGVLLLAPLITSIPLAALAGLLIHVGVKLVDVKQITELRAHRDLPMYGATIAGILLLDLVEGVLVGLLIGLVFLTRRASWKHVTTEIVDGVHVVRLRGSLGFLAVPGITSALNEVPESSPARIDIDAEFMDHAAISVVTDWIDGHRRRGGRVTVDEHGHGWLAQGSEGSPIVTRDLVPQQSTNLTVTPWWVRRAGQSNLSVLQGVSDFARHADAARPLLAELATAQSPTCLFVTCCDSRVVPHLITASGPGDLFITRTIGNIIPPFTPEQPAAGASFYATLEYAVDFLHVQEIVVCGHSACGAMKALIDDNIGGEYLSLQTWLDQSTPVLADHVRAARAGVVSPDDVARANVRSQVDRLCTHPLVAPRVEAGTLRVIGLYFDIGSAHTSIIETRGDFAVREADREPAALSTQ